MVTPQFIMGPMSHQPPLPSLVCYFASSFWFPLLSKSSFNCWAVASFCRIFPIWSAPTSQESTKRQPTTSAFRFSAHRAELALGRQELNNNDGIARRTTMSAGAAVLRPLPHPRTSPSSFELHFISNYNFSSFIKVLQKIVVSREGRRGMACWTIFHHIKYDDSNECGGGGD